MDAYGRAASYLSVGQSYRYDNPLLKRPLALTGALGYDTRAKLHLIERLEEATETREGANTGSAGVRPVPVRPPVAHSSSSSAGDVPPRVDQGSGGLVGVMVAQPSSFVAVGLDAISDAWPQAPARPSARTSPRTRRRCGTYTNYRFMRADTDHQRLREAAVASVLATLPARFSSRAVTNDEAQPSLLRQRG